MAMGAIAQRFRGLVPWLAYGAILVIPLPAAWGLALRYDPAIALLGIAILASLTALPLGTPIGRPQTCLGRPQTSRWDFPSLGQTLLLFALPLAGLWNSGVSDDPNLLGGLFPLTDGSNYYTDARRILDGGRMNAVSSSRPLFPGLLATLLGLTQQNLALTIACLVAITAIACHLACREVQRTHGIGAAFTLLAGLFLFYRRFLGTVWTENLGLALGAIAFALLWSAIHERRAVRFLGGLLTLTLALNARSGAFLVLPMLIGWGHWYFTGGDRPDWGTPPAPAPQEGAGMKRHPRFPPWSAWADIPVWMMRRAWVIPAVGLVGLGFGLNQGVLQMVGMPELGHANFAYVLYAQVVESLDWRQVQIDHPEILRLSQPQLTQRIYGLTWMAFCAHPLGLLRSAIRAIFTYLSPTPAGAFGFISTFGHTWSNQLWIAGFYSLSGLGWYACLRRRGAIATALLWVHGGILASIPLAPPWMDGSYASLRMYAATLPFTAVLPALGMAQLWSGWPGLTPMSGRESPSPAGPTKGRREETGGAMHRDWDWPMGVAIALVGLTLGGAIATKHLSHPAALPPGSCPGSSRAIPIWFHPGSAIRLVGDRPLAHLPDVRLQPFRRGVTTVVASLAQRRSRLTEETRELLTIEPGHTLIDALNLDSHQRLWVVMATSEEPSQVGAIALCGVLRHQVLYVTSLSQS